MDMEADYNKIDDNKVKGPAPGGAALSHADKPKMAGDSAGHFPVGTASGALPLGGLTAVVEGEWAPAASTGLATAVAAAAT